MPLVEQLVEVELDVGSGTLSVCPRATRPVLATEGPDGFSMRRWVHVRSASLQMRLDMLLDNPDHPFNPHRPETWEPAVASAANVVAARCTLLIPYRTG